MDEDQIKHFRKVESKKIGIIGLGFVGLPLAMLFVKKGFFVSGIDIDEEKITKIKQAKSYISDLSDEDVRNALSTGRFLVTSDYNEVKDLDVLIICVPTPLTPYSSPDLSYLQQVGNELSTRLKKGHLVILESSTYPGTTEEVLLPILQTSGLKVGTDFNLANSPERIDPGNKAYKVEEIPKVVSGLTEKCLQAVHTIYSCIFNTVVKVSTLKAAELTKLIENSYRFINISFINEMAILCDEMNINIWEVIEAANTKPYGYQSFYPGPGIGGHCIPVDPLYLSWKVEQYGLKSSFIMLADQINEQIPRYIVKQLKSLIPISNETPIPKVIIFGLTYKKDIDDVRESPALTILRYLLDEGFEVSYHDPYVPNVTVREKTLTSCLVTRETLENVDCALILTDHSNTPIQFILTHAKMVYDTRNVTKGLNGNSKIIRLGGGGE